MPACVCPPAAQGAIHESIKALDHEGMAAIESGDPQRFEEYLQATGNTICGRHPIAVLLQVCSGGVTNFWLLSFFYRIRVGWGRWSAPR